ncbi:PstS family phosphate ABC transporter substrate-binding protein [Streptacidiphilus jiangxiensis]|uniref:ABC-type phosphate transport system, substrate-binding protein n=1 Tax=Streptacidiphilus jiangxiensis TaxID=235985 RepID=A0A1H7LXS6_STRJI|nr:substrate-binding domain-containing protein [Streptacidiphilus jiangxiensis]SEL03558.1 ABC-type phosphate transport system, substrate-binding protein [Streptacidiphilus jiangxiensis]
MRTLRPSKPLLAAALGCAAALLAAGPALADPSVTPAATDIVGVGSDTTQALFNQLSTDYTGTPHLYSWDATGTSPITPKTGASSIARPNGSSAGITALAANTSATIDYARSSRGPKIGSDPTGLSFIAFAKDAVSWASEKSGDAPTNLTTADLKSIFTCTYTKWNQITDISGYTGSANTIQAFLPQLGSGTRSFFESVIGITDAQVGSCVNQTVEENEGTNTLLQTKDSIVPYSVGHYIGQVYGGHTTTTDAPGPLVVQETNGIAPIDTTNKVISSAEASSPYARTLYNVVRTADWNKGDAHATALKAIFGSTGYVCKNTKAVADVKSYGFLPLGLCGGITTT